MQISIAKDFSTTPGFRYKKEGPASGEEFREEKLEPWFKNEKFTKVITINLDGTVGYATSFLEEAFGGLARKYGIDRVLSQLTFVSDDDPLLIDEIKDYIKHSNEKV